MFKGIKSFIKRGSTLKERSQNITAGTIILILLGLLFLQGFLFWREDPSYTPRVVRQPIMWFLFSVYASLSFWRANKARKTITSQLLLAISAGLLIASIVVAILNIV